MAATVGTKTWKYPTPARDDVVDVLHGVSVPDPYRWLEDPDAPRTVEWVQQQNEITESLFADHKDMREKLTEELKRGINYERCSCPWKRGENFFYNHNSGLQNQSVMYILRGSLEATPEVFINPNDMSSDGTTAVKATGFAESGAIMAYSLTKSGSDWETIYVKNVTTGEVLPDRIEWCKFTGIAWTHDDAGFFYTRYPAPQQLQGQDEEKRGAETSESKHASLYYHVVGTPQDDDLLVIKFPEEPEWRPHGEVSDDGKHVIITVSATCDPVNHFYIGDAHDLVTRLKAEGQLSVTKIIQTFDFGYDYITNEGSVFYVKTNRDAPCYKVMSFDTSVEGGAWKDIVPEQPNSVVLESVSCVHGDKLVLTYLEHVTHHLRITDMSGKQIKVVNGPSVGVFNSQTGRKTDSWMFYYFMNLVEPGIIFRLDMTTFDTTVWRKIEVPGHNAEDFEVKQVFYESKDSTKIPMFIIHLKGQDFDGSCLTRLYGYGGFNISLLPSFSCFDTTFVRLFKGVVATPNIRGGGEYGETWHQAGVKSRKQNVFDDFAAAGEYLIANKYTSNKRLFIVGGSNGGLLTCACGIQRPDLFGAVISQVGVLDMLRFHKFTIGHAWTSDFGNPDIEEDFRAIHKYSPVHNIRPLEPPQQFPALLLTTADHDDRVVPLHSYKFIAEAQHVWGQMPHQTNPLLIRIEVKAGHGAGKPIAKRVAEVADMYIFVSSVLGVSPSY